jgi:hypothetical protein
VNLALGFVNENLVKLEQEILELEVLLVELAVGVVGGLVEEAVLVVAVLISLARGDGFKFLDEGAPDLDQFWSGPVAAAPLLPDDLSEQGDVAL